MNPENRQDVKDAKKSLPEGWRRMRLGEVLRLRKEIVHPYDGLNCSAAFVGLEHIETGTGRRTGAECVEMAQLEGRKPRFYRGDIVYGYLRPYLNKVWIAEFDGLCSVDQYVYSVDQERISVEFVAWFMRSSVYLESAPIGRSPGQLPRIRTEEVASVDIALPPLGEQRRIAAALKGQMAAVERARAAAKARLEAAKALPAAHLRAALMGSACKGWSRTRLGEVCELLPSKSIATDGDTQVQAITTACLTESGFAPSGVKQARMWKDHAAECVVRPGEILVARSNTPELVGRAAVFLGEPSGAVATDLTIRIWPKEGLVPGFLVAHLSCLYLTGYWKSRAGGASGSMKKITREQIQAEQIPVPPLEVQKRIVCDIRERLRESRRVREAAEAELAAINALPAALLRRAFSGAL